MARSEKPSHPGRGWQRPNAARPKLKDVAAACGVSIGTVSRVLNRDESFSAREEVRQRILDAAEQLGYAPDLAARNLNRGETQIIGVFGDPKTHIGEGINDAVFEGIAEGVRSQDYDVFFDVTSKHATGRKLPFWRFDGAILIQSPLPEVVEELDRRHVPYVSVNETVGTPIASILADDVMGATRMMEHLAGLGHRRIAYANAAKGYFEHYSVPCRHDTIQAFCKEYGLTLIPGHDEDFLSADQFLRQAVIEQGATAVLAYDHRIVVKILGTAYRLGLSVPGDFSLACFNDEFPVAELYPPLTVVSVSGKAMGRTAAAILLDAMRPSQPPDRPSTLRLEEKVVVRASTAPPKHVES